MAMFRRSTNTPPPSRNHNNNNNNNNNNNSIHRTYHTQQQEPGQDADRLLLLQWLHEQSLSTAGPWDLYQSRQYADLWYGARAAAERTRALALEHLYRNRPYPGGSHPDPRLPAAFSTRAVLIEAAHLLGLRIDPSFNIHYQGDESAGEIEIENELENEGVNEMEGEGEGEEEQQQWQRWSAREPHPHPQTPTRPLTPGMPMTELEEEAEGHPPFAWLVTFPHVRGRRRSPEIVIRSMRIDPFLLEHKIACLFGYWQHDYRRLSDPDAPTGMILLPRDPGLVAVLHQYAIALLCLEAECPPHWKCQCNAIRARFNAPPPDHDRPTGVFEIGALEHPGESAHQRRDSEPRFPYIDPNTWNSSAPGPNDTNDTNDTNGDQEG